MRSYLPQRVSFMAPPSFFLLLLASSIDESIGANNFGEGERPSHELTAVFSNWPARETKLISV